MKPKIGTLITFPHPLTKKHASPEANEACFNLLPDCIGARRPQECPGMWRCVEAYLGLVAGH